MSTSIRNSLDDLRLVLHPSAHEMGGVDKNYKTAPMHCVSYSTNTQSLVVEKLCAYLEMNLTDVISPDCTESNCGK